MFKAIMQRLFPAKPVTLAIIGGGSRGQMYATYAGLNPAMAKVVAVAEPRLEWREKLAQAHGLTAGQCFHSWEELLAGPKLADAVVIATPDALHLAPCLAAVEQGYHLLVEKPLALREEDCASIVAAVKSAGVQMAVAHVLRYTAHTHAMKELLNSGRIGQIVSIQHLEPVGYWHQAHSFVRGNWRIESQSTFMLLAKSCHDLDWLRYIMDVPCTAVSSFGGLFHFRPENKPAKAADRCVDCSVASKCPYDAQRIYLGRYDQGQRHWPLDVLTPDVTRNGLESALRNGPYGRCVYNCDNDVVDHQVVNLQFANGATASFTMTAFTESAPRSTKIFGTRGQISTDGVSIEVLEFLTDKKETITPTAGTSGHSGGDFGLMQSFLQAIQTKDATHVLSGPDATLESHRMVFAAERARRNSSVERIVV